MSMAPSRLLGVGCNRHLIKSWATGSKFYLNYSSLGLYCLMFMYVSSLVLPLNGVLPVSIWYKITPNDHKSLA